MAFQKGNKFGKGGRNNPPGGRPTKEQQEKKRIEAETAKAIIEKHAAKLANRLVNDAMTVEGRRSLHVAINKLVPDARQVIDLNISTPEDFYRDIEESKKR
jgi:hypothetical protein